MFTGLIEDLGRIESISVHSGDRRIIIGSEKIADGLRPGDSVSVNGVCLTAESVDKGLITVTAVNETVQRSTVKFFQSGMKVNLERALTLSDRLGGHMVQGHVDGMAKITDIKKINSGWTFGLILPSELIKYTVEKGSIAVDGISLTIAKKKENTLQLAIIPQTFTATSLHLKKPGDLINIEVDLIAKYVEQMFQNRLAHGHEEEKWRKLLGK